VLYERLKKEQPLRRNKRPTDKPVNHFFISKTSVYSL
jgi:hypothetical protein